MTRIKRYLVLSAILLVLFVLYQGVIAGGVVFNGISPDQSPVAAAPPDQYARPDSDVCTDFWVTVPLWSKIDEKTAESADYIQSGDDPAEDGCEVGLSDVTDPDSSNNHILSYQWQAPESGGGKPAAIDFTVKLMEGENERASWLLQPDPPTTWATTEQTLTKAQADSIMDYTNLSLRFIANKTEGGRTTRIEVSWAEFKLPG